MLSIIPIIIGTIVFFKLNKFYQFTVLSLAALLPFSFGNFMSIPDLLIVEWLTFVCFIITINELIPLHNSNKGFRYLKFRGVELFFVAIAILIIWTLASYIKYELLADQVKQIGEKRGIFRLYFTIFNNILLFFTILIFSSAFYEQIDFGKYIKIILVIAIYLGIIRIFSYFFSFQIPFMSGTFKYDPNAMRSYGGIAYRFGGLSEVVTIGIPALFSYYIVNGKMKLFSLLLLLLFVFLSGGRTVMAGVFFSIVVFSFLFLPRNFIYLITTIGIFLILVTLFAPESVLKGQFARLTTLNAGNFMGQDAWRGLAWQFYLENFYKNPIWGKGIGAYSGFIYSSFEGAKDFTIQMLFTGGHGSYLSLLSTFGLGGITYFLIMLWGGAYLSYRKIKQYLNIDKSKTAIAVFCFMLLLIKSVDFTTGGDGLSEATIMFFTVGFICSLTVLQNRIDLK